MTQMSATGAHRSLGFTLLELLLVLAILGTTAWIGAVAYGTLASTRTDRHMEALAEWLLTLRRQAMLGGIVIEVDADGGELRARSGGAVRAVLRTADQTVGINAAQPSCQFLRFYPDGSTCSAEVNLAQGARKRRIEVDWFGSVTVMPEGLHGS